MIHLASTLTTLLDEVVIQNGIRSKSNQSLSILIPPPLISIKIPINSMLQDFQSNTSGRGEDINIK